MTFFECELLALFREDIHLRNIMAMGNCCYGELSPDMRMKSYFVHTDVVGHYSAIRITVFNKNMPGLVDSIDIRFKDVWPERRVRRDTGELSVPCIIEPKPYLSREDPEWTDCDRAPDKEDFTELRNMIDKYLGLFE